MTARSIARSTRSGTLVGPGIWRNGRPLTLLLLHRLSAVPTGFEPAISSLTGTYARPLHHGTMRCESVFVLPSRLTILTETKKEAASALPFTRRLCRCGRCQSLGRRQRPLPKTFRHLIRQSAGPCEPREREVETRLL